MCKIQMSLTSVEKPVYYVQVSGRGRDHGYVGGNRDYDHRR